MAYDASAAAGQTPSGRHDRGKVIREIAEEAFKLQLRYCQKWQRIAEIFDPANADFTGQQIEELDPRDNLYTSHPEQLSQSLARRIASMTRPKGVEWFKLGAFPEPIMKRQDIKAWCADTTERQRNAIYAARAGFSREMAGADSDWVNYGNAVVRHTYNNNRSGLLFTSPKLRDCAWNEDAERNVNQFFERMEPTLSQAAALFGAGNLPKKQRERLEKHPQERMKVIRCTLPIDSYQFERYERPRQGAEYVSSYYVCDADAKDAVLGEGFFNVFPYAVRRWTLRGPSQYARSPVTEVALADGRVLNVAEQAALIGIEWTANPPRSSPDDAMVGEIALESGKAVYWRHGENGEYKGEDILRPIQSGEPKTALQYIELKEMKMARIFLEHLLEWPDKEMTATETREWLKRIMRENAPVFEPVEADYAVLMDGVFDRMAQAIPGKPWGAFDPPPDDLMQGGQTRFEFLTALHEAQREVERSEAIEVLEQKARLVELQDPAADYINMDEVTKASMGNFKPEWTRSDDDVAALRAQRQAQLEAQAQEESAALAISEAMKAKPENVRMLKAEAERAGLQ